MAQHTCDCGQQYAVVNNRVAKPGFTKTTKSYVAVEDIYGRVTGHRYANSGHWVREGEDVTITRHDDGGPTWTYTFPCGDHTTSYEEPAYDVVLCKDCGPRESHYSLSGTDHRRCSCCYGNRPHNVYRDPSAQVNQPVCLARATSAA